MFPREKVIGLVYDGSVNGLNDAMWMPRFVMHTLNTHLRSIEAGTFLADINVGEMFLNFILHELVQEHPGIRTLNRRFGSIAFSPLK